MQAPQNLFETPPSWNQYFTQLYGSVPGYEGKEARSITFVVTEDCNLRCSYCYEQHKNPSKMTWEVAKQAVDLILDDSLLGGYYNTGSIAGVSLEFMGGEPLLEIDLIRRIAAYFKYRAMELGHPWRNHYMFSIGTNGLQYRDERVQAFLRENAGRVSVGITIDGHRELHDRCRVDLEGKGSYDRVRRSVELWLGQSARTSTKVTFASESLSDISAAIVHLFELGISDVAANVVFENVWKSGDDRVFYLQLLRLADEIIDRDLYKTHSCSLFMSYIGQPMPPTENMNWCGGDGRMLTIGTDGRLYPCVRYTHFASVTGVYPPIVIGDVRKGVDTGTPALRELQCITRRSQSTDECFFCEVASGCAWCSGYNYDLYGTADKRATFICRMHRARAYANYYFWNKLWGKLGYDNRLICNLSGEQRDHLDRGTAGGRGA